MKVQFLEVKDNTAKISRICAVVQHHFTQKESILIKVPSPEAAEYINQLLWRLPEESFLPHSIAQTDCQEMIAITMASTNINQAKILLNLCPEAVSSTEGYLKIYDLLDCTHPEKERLSRKRMADYQFRDIICGQ